jgi:hypothetical protein
MQLYKVLQSGIADSVSGVNPIEIFKSTVDIPVGVIAGDANNLVSAATFTMRNLTGSAINAYAAVFDGPVWFRGGASIDFDFTPGSVIFAGPSGVLAQNNSKFYWDDTNYRLGIGTAAPGALFHLHGVSGTSEVGRLGGLQAANTVGHYVTFMGGVGGATARGYIGYAHTGAGANTMLSDEIADAFIVMAQSGQALQFGAGGSSRVTILTGGNVG